MGDAAGHVFGVRLIGIEVGVRLFGDAVEQILEREVTFYAFTLAYGRCGAQLAY